MLYLRQIFVLWKLLMLKRRQANFNEEVLSLIQGAGYNNLTMFQKQVMPYIFRNKNVIVTTFDYPGKTAAFILPLIVKLERKLKGIKAIVLTSKALDLKKIFSEFKLYTKQRKLSAVILNEDDEIKAEIKYLNKKPDVVISTPKRLIDHIRQKNLEFPNLSTVVITDTQDTIDSLFYDDLQFIFSKFPQKFQIILYAQNNNLNIKNPVIITDKAFNKNKDRHYNLRVNLEEKQFLLRDLIISKNFENFLIFCDSEKDVKEIQKNILKHNIRTVKLPLKKGSIPFEKGFITKSSLLYEHLKHIQVSNIINYSIPRDGREYLKRCRLMQGKIKQVFNLASEKEMIFLNKIQETCKVDTKNEKKPTNKDVIKGLIKNIIKIIKEDEDPEELNKYRKIVKQNVPIYLRAYFSAYLFKQSLGKDKLIIEERKNGFTTLFISIGKNRRVFPKDLIQFFISNLQIKQTDIGEIKILDNYSFLDISVNHASKAISKLSNINFRGRNLKVNLARKRGNSK